jgi:hypothetical protein
VRTQSILLITCNFCPRALCLLLKLYPIFDFGIFSPYSIGHRDLDPLGGAPPLFGHPFGGGRGNGNPLANPFGGGPGIYGDVGGGSIMGPGHPLFGEDHSGPSRPWGGDGFLPRYVTTG